jgi:hypothetical protein
VYLTAMEGSVGSAREHVAHIQEKGTPTHHHAPVAVLVEWAESEDLMVGCW